MSNYRIVKNTFSDETVMYAVEKQSIACPDRWNRITNRETIDEARSLIEFLKGQELVSSEVVE